MTDREFVSVFVQQKERFVKQNSSQGINCKTLDLFEDWIKRKLDTGAKTSEKSCCKQKQDLSSILDQTVNKAENILLNQNIRIKRISLNVPATKSKTRCLKVYPYESVYYKVCKTSPRKGKYKGHNLIAIELVMDGHKNNIFMPMANEKINIERQLGLKVERERPPVEATGKYRLKVLFDIGEEGEQEISRQLGTALADFVLVTSHYLQKISRTA